MIYYSPSHIQVLLGLVLSKHSVSRLLIQTKVHWFSGSEHRTSMSAAFIVRRMDPFVVIVRKAIASFRKWMYSSENILVKTVVDSAFFTFCRLSRRWRKAWFYIDGENS